MNRGKKRWRYFKSGEGTSGETERPPKHLRGRDIGLWHAQRKRERNEKEALRLGCEVQDFRVRKEAKEARREAKNSLADKKPLGSILISENKKQHINKLLIETASMYPSAFNEKTNSYEHLEETDFKHEFLQHITGNIIQKLKSTPKISLQWKNDVQDTLFLKELEQKKISKSYKEMQKIRGKLPSMNMRDSILDLVEKNQVTVISGETGCGKTTQVAQFILDDYIQKEKGSECRIICTQPRRISAISVAERVACERDEKLGHSVGFQIRLEKFPVAVAMAFGSDVSKRIELYNALETYSSPDKKIQVCRDCWIHSPFYDPLLLMGDIAIINLLQTVEFTATIQPVKILPRERGSILFCTTGVLLKFMESSPSLNEVSHLILDEIHERDVTSDFLITVLKDVIQYRSDIKIILMSATLNSEAFSKYYDNAPHINIPGFTYPVIEYFLEDALQFTGYKFNEDKRPIWKRKREGHQDRERYAFIEPYIRQLEAEKKYNRDVINELIKPEADLLDLPLIFTLLIKLCQTDNDDGAILIFVPGFFEISALCKRIRESGQFPAYKYTIIPLHSQLPTVDQKQIFNPAPKGVRKIIISTNIAETSITIDDVTTVIDSGFIKISNLDPQSGIETLKSEWVSQANAAQRKGRAGRVKPGVCYHLMTRMRYDLVDKFLKPEVLRKRLDDVILQLKMLQLGDAEPFLAKLMDPPESRSVQISIDVLKRLGALDHEENLTPLGFHMAKLPVGAHCSKMLILAALFSCVDPILSVAASLGFKDAYQLSADAQDADRKRCELSQGTNSDHITMHYAVRGFEDANNPYAFCREYYLSSSTLRLLIDMRKQFAEQLFNMKFISDPHPRSASNNHNSENIGLVKAIISAGLYPNVGIFVKCLKRGGGIIRSLSHERMELHQKSVLAQTTSFPSPLIVYFVRLKSTKIFVHDATLVFPLPIVFFGDQFRNHSQSDEEDSFNGVSINGNMRFLCTDSTSVVIEKLRDRLNQILEWKVAHPAFVDWGRDTSETKILRVIMDLITIEDNEELALSDYDDM